MVFCCFMSILVWDLFCGDESRVITSKIFGALDFFFSFDVDKRLFETVRSVCVFLLEVCSFIFVGVCMILLFLRVFRNLFMSSSVGMYCCCCLIFVIWSFLVFLG